jgi:hypothetical protein
VYKLWSSSVCSLLQPLATSSLLGPNILLSAPSSDCCYFSARDHISRPYKTTGKIIFVYFNI